MVDSVGEGEGVEGHPARGIPRGQQIRAGTPCPLCPHDVSPFEPTVSVVCCGIFSTKYIVLCVFFRFVYISYNIANVVETHAFDSLITWSRTVNHTRTRTSMRTTHTQPTGRPCLPRLSTSTSILHACSSHRHRHRYSPGCTAAMAMATQTHARYLQSNYHPGPYLSTFAPEHTTFLGVLPS